MILTVDRTEESIVLLQDDSGVFYHFPVAAFSRPPRDGDIFRYLPNDPIPLVYDEVQTKAKKERASSRFEALLARRSKG